MSDQRSPDHNGKLIDSLRRCLQLFLAKRLFSLGMNSSVMRSSPSSAERRRYICEQANLAS